MNVVIAAIDNSLASEPVLRVAKLAARALDARPEAIHVPENGARTARALAEGAGIPLRMVTGEPAAAIIRRLAEPDTILGVIGVRGLPGGARPAGHTALTVIEGSHKPVIAVPPDACVPAAEAVRRILVPLDGTIATSRALKGVAEAFAGHGVEVLAVHVFDASTTPLFLDRPEHDVGDWAYEFLQRYCEPASRLATRTGAPGQQVVDLAAEEEADLIVLGWSQDLSPGHASVVREALARSCLPVVLIPIGSMHPAPA